MIRHRIATVRTMLICLLALAVLAFRAPVTDPSDLAQVVTVTDVHIGHSHDHHGHSHDDEDEPSVPYDHDRFHIGDHSHDTPTAAVLFSFGFASPEGSEPGTRDKLATSRPTPPGDRPPRQA